MHLLPRRDGLHLSLSVRALLFVCAELVPCGCQAAAGGQAVARWWGLWWPVHIFFRNHPSPRANGTSRHTSTGTGTHGSRRRGLHRLGHAESFLLVKAPP
jgi:hypothetical protein